MSDDQDRNEPIWCEYQGFVAKETDKAIGLHTEFPAPHGSIEMWLPKSQLKGVEYDDGGDSLDIREGEGIRAVLVPRWLADKNDLGPVEDGPAF